LLASDIAAGNLEVRELADRSIITLPGDGLFAAGSDELQDAQKPLLARVGSALASLPGQLLISGHMDSSPIESPRFPSHWHLSKARAQRVRDALAERVDPARLTVEGRADTEPVDDNGSAGGRAHNRRVEIRWLHAAPADGAAR
jgi:type VI secretion system protein ImpK